MVISEKENIFRQFLKGVISGGHSKSFKFNFRQLPKDWSKIRSGKEFYKKLEEIIGFLI